jgi:transposase
MRIFGMSAEDREVSASLLADTKQAGAKRRRWPDALKRELVTAAMAPGASVSVIARRHDVNSNQLFKWCRQFGNAASAQPTGFLPVEITALSGVPPPTPIAAGKAGPFEPALVAAALPGSIEIALPGGIRVTVTGMVEARMVTAALRAIMAKRRRR